MQFQLHRSGEQQVVDLDGLRQMARVGQLPQDEWVFDERTQAWLGAGLIEELKDAWNLDSNDRTVAMQISPADLAALAAAQAARIAPAAASPAVIAVAPVAVAPVAKRSDALAPQSPTKSNAVWYVGFTAAAIAIAAAFLLLK